MKRSSIRIPILAAGLGMLVLILDSRCASQSASEALSLCLQTVIPSLFPMFVLSGLLVSGLSASGPFTTGLERLLGLPRGSGSLFLLGILGGFPVGAQCVTQAVERGSLSKTDGERMLGFCNNCSPAFLFGIGGNLFRDSSVPLLIFLIQLESAALIAAFTHFSGVNSTGPSKTRISLPGAVSRGVRSMVTVCAWVILAGVVTGFLDRWIFPLLPKPVPLIIQGLLEITGGVLGLGTVPDPRLSFVLCSGFVCFGGVSVLMQIQSICAEKGLSVSSCVRQKLVQCALGVILSGAVAAWGPVCLLIPGAILPFCKKALEKPITSVYNNSRKGGFDHVIPKKN